MNKLIIFYQYEQFDVSYLDFIKLAFTNQRFRNLIGRDNVKKFNIKWTAHIAKIKENVDPGNDKNMEKEDDPNTAGRQENNDNKSKEVIEKVKLLKVHDTTMDPDKPSLSVRIQTLSMLVQVLIKLLSRIN